MINGDRAGSNWGNGGGWADGTGGVYPDWLQIDFGTTRTISEVDVFTIQDNYSSPSEPTEAMTFTQYGLLDYRVQYDSGSGIWLTLPGAIVTGNNLVWRKFTFAPVETTAIRVYVSSGAAGYSRIAEVEAY